jgi:transposase
LVDRVGVPLAVGVGPANLHDNRALKPMVGALKPIRGRRGRPLRLPRKLHADKGFDAAWCRWWLRRQGILPRIARRGIESKQRLGRFRWVVERTQAWWLGFRQLQVRYERREDILLGFVDLAGAVICLRICTSTSSEHRDRSGTSASAWCNGAALGTMARRRRHWVRDLAGASPGSPTDS